MEAIKFDESNIVIGKNQKQFKDLPAHLSHENGLVIACFELTEEEIKTITETGKLWHSQQVGNAYYQPTFLTVNKSDLFELVEKTESEIMNMDVAPDADPTGTGEEE